MDTTVLNKDKIRLGGGRVPSFQKWYRLTQGSKNPFILFFCRLIFRYKRNKRFIELSHVTNIGEGVYFGHAFGITINPKTVIGKNCNIHKGVTIGQENRGVRKGTPIIGNKVWIGINATIVGAITIGDDVLIAPNSYVNRDIPSHSIVFGNPCQIKHRDHATEGYINNLVND